MKVSTGGNKILFLPDEDNVNIVASVIPPPSGESYRFEWDIIPRGEDASTATIPLMEGQHEQRLQLSKV